MTLTSQGRCQFHIRHIPRALYTEQHHWVPVAWQQHWQPVTAPFPGVDAEGRGNLWDARTVSLCRTGHGNLHFVLVAAMREVAKDPALTAEQAVGRAAKQHGYKPKGAPEVDGALEAMRRYQGAGGDLPDLATHGLYGQI